MRPKYLDAIEAEFSAKLGAKPPAYTDKLTLFIAHSDKYGTEVPDVGKWVAEAENVLARIGGGATSVTARGAWLGSRVSVLSEKTTLVYTYAAPNKILTHIRSVSEFVFAFGAQTAQEEVAVLLENADGDWFFSIPVRASRQSIPIGESSSV